jgi:hypothetical protein
MTTRWDSQRRALARGAAVHVARNSHRTLATWLVISAISAQAAASQNIRVGDTVPDVAQRIGMSVAASGGPRDTLGLLVASVTRDGPADQAGLTMGSRILAVNGYLVRLAPSEIGQRAAADTAMARFDRAIRTTPHGGSVALHIIGFGRTRMVTVPVPDQQVAGAQRSAPSESRGDTAPRIGAVTAVSAPDSPPMPRAVPPVPPSQTESDAPGGASAPAAIANTASRTAATSSIITPDAPLVRTNRSATAVATQLAEAQLDLRRLARETRSLAMSDSLAELEAQLGALRRRLQALSIDSASTARTAMATPRSDSSASVARAPVVPAPVVPAPVVPAPVAPTPLPPSPVPPVAIAPVRIVADGLELTSVSGELATYLGPQASAALVVTRASEVWEPMRAGDVLLKVDGRAPDPVGLRVALNARQHISVLLLRRGRSFTVTFGNEQSP